MRSFRNRALSQRGFASICALGALLVSGLAAIVGSAGHSRLINLLDGHGWVANDDKGQVLLANGTTGRVDLKLEVKGAGGHGLEVVQAGPTAMLYDRSSGQIGTIDLGSFKVVNQDGAGAGVDVVASQTTVFVIHQKLGTVEARDPLSNKVLGSATVGKDLSNSVIDDNGTLWLVNGGGGELVSATFTGGKLQETKHSRVAAPGAKVLMTLANGVPAVLNESQSAYIRAPGGQAAAPVTLPLDANQRPVLAPTIVGPVVPVAVNTTGQLLLITGNSESVADIAGRAGHNLDGPVTFANRIYVPDFTSGDVAVLDGHGQVAGQSIPVRAGGGQFRTYVQNGALWINDPNGPSSWSVDASGNVHSVDKGVANVPTNAAPVVTTPVPVPVPVGPVAPVAPPPAPPVPAQPTVPTVPPSAPSAPGAVTAQAGNASVSLTWAGANPHGSAISRYDVTWTGGAGGSKTVAGGQTSLSVTGLTNGTTYTFSVSATNAVGSGPAAPTNPATPTSAVPDAPSSVTAAAKSDGTVDVSWQAANGQGHAITGYTVFASDSQNPSPVNVGQTTTGPLTVPASALTAGSQYTFTVTATNDANASSKPSSPSSAVTVFTKSSAPTSFTAHGSDGQVALTWGSPQNPGGGTVVDYVVSIAGDSASAVTTSGKSHTFTGLANGTTYGFLVVAETTANGQKATGQAASTSGTPGAAPTLSGESANANGSTNSIRVDFTVDTHNSGANCHVTAGSASWSGACSGPESHNLGGLNAGTTYTVVVSASNKYGNAPSWSGQATTAQPPPPPPPPAPSVAIAKGDAYSGGSCSNSSCRWLDIGLSNFTPNTTYSVQCDSSSAGTFYTVKMTTDGNGNAHSTGTNPKTCFFGYPGQQIWVTVNGTRSNTITW
jgi:hypothetical protein